MATIDCEQMHRLTRKKAVEIAEREEMTITGFVLTGKDGTVSIVDKSAVRWLLKHQFKRVMTGTIEGDM